MDRLLTVSETELASSMISLMTLETMLACSCPATALSETMETVWVIFEVMSELCLMTETISLVELEVRAASCRTSSATTAKPRPCSPALAASMAALSASRLV
ncbi:hypothetical protein D3C78_1129610 [compost metagenome]